MPVKPKKAILFIPFWKQHGHVGNNRIDRFVRWLTEENYQIILIRAGSKNGVQQNVWGKEITVKDPLGLYRDSTREICVSLARKPNPYRRTLAYWLFIPDPTIVWALVAARHPEVLGEISGAAFILSSSPPESAHVGAWLLSRRAGIPHIVDMRDGWLDEPLKPLLHSSALRRWLEKQLEARILKKACAIQVTSEVWKELLCERYPSFFPKIHVLTNGYPNGIEPQQNQINKINKERVLIHAGRFAESHLSRLPNLLLEPLLENLSIRPEKGVIELIGSLTDEELKIVEAMKPRFEKIGWRIEYFGFMQRNELLELLTKVDGLLLLSASHAAVPSKLFEYIPTAKPVFVVTSKESATWKICETLPQATLREILSSHKTAVQLSTQPFYLINHVDVPPKFSEKFLYKIFKKILP